MSAVPPVTPDSTLASSASEKLATTIPRSGGEKPERIGKYEIRDEAGRGACGIVYRAFDPFVQRDVAIKIASRGTQATPAATNSPDRHNFFVEARAAGMLQHPHIVSLYDAGVEGDLNYLVMEFVDGRTLRDYCQKDGERLSIEKVVEVVFKCSKALDYAHAKGVLHRDIKPSNLMIGENNVVKIMDFSVAELNRDRAPGAKGSVVGSPLYMSPEQIMAEPLGPQSDLYSLGAVMFELFAGEPPFFINDIPQLFEMIKNQPAPSMATKCPDLPLELSMIVDRLLRKDPADRFQSGGELAAVLTRIYDRLRYSGEQIARRESQDTLRSLGFFNDFTDSEIDEILNVSTMVSFKKGDVIIQEGDIDNTFYIIALGQVDVKKAGKTLQTFGKGDCFGEIGFLMNTKRTATIVANTPVVVLKVNATQMQRVSKECQLRYYKVFTENLIYRLSYTTAKLAAISDK